MTPDTSRDEDRYRKQGFGNEMGMAVSYTHLTLPTKA